MGKNGNSGAGPTTWDTSVGVISMRDDGVALFESKPGAEETLATAQEVVEGYGRLGGGRRLLVVADIRRARSADRGARAYYAGDEMAAVAIGLALVVDSGISRVIGNFFLGLNKPRIPTRLFKTIDEAVAWLKGLSEGSRH